MAGVIPGDRADSCCQELLCAFAVRQLYSFSVPYSCLSEHVPLPPSMKQENGNFCLFVFPGARGGSVDICFYILQGDLGRRISLAA